MCVLRNGKLFKQMGAHEFYVKFVSHSDGEIEIQRLERIMSQLTAKCVCVCVCVDKVPKIPKSIDLKCEICNSTYDP